MKSWQSQTRSNPDQPGFLQRHHDFLIVFITLFAASVLHVLGGLSNCTKKSSHYAACAEHLQRLLPSPEEFAGLCPDENKFSMFLEARAPAGPNRCYLEFGDPSSPMHLKVSLASIDKKFYAKELALQYTKMHLKTRSEDGTPPDDATAIKNVRKLPWRGGNIFQADDRSGWNLGAETKSGKTYGIQVSIAPLFDEGKSCVRGITEFILKKATSTEHVK